MYNMDEVSATHMYPSHHYQSPFSLPPQFRLQQLLGSCSCDPPWASSTLTNDDNILKWSGSPISGTQTQISGSSPLKRAPGTVPWLPNLNQQQRTRENDRAWTAATLPPHSTSAKQLPHPHPLLYLFLPQTVSFTLFWISKSPFPSME